MTVLNREYHGQNCSIARALELVGERWTLLIIRDAFLGLRRFDEFQESLGISRNVLTDRLNRLVEEGILEAIPYGIRQDRYDYQLTRMGLDLHVALVGLRQWGDKYLCDAPPTLARCLRTGGLFAAEEMVVEFRGQPIDGACQLRVLDEQLLDGSVVVV